MILLVEDDDTFRLFLETVLTDAGHGVKTAANGREGLAMLRRESFGLVITDLSMPSLGGMDLFRQVCQEPFPPPFIFITAYGRVGDAVEAMKQGAFDFLTKPLESPDTLLCTVERALESRRVHKTLQAFREAEEVGLPPMDLIFAGDAMEPVRRLVESVAPTQAGVLVQGESGTGKEIIARVTHRLSPRRDAPFIPLNCAAMPENLVESELFGHERGAFTGALQARAGKFELADKGTIFLDEIGELSLPVQAKLLRVIQERTFERVGGSRLIGSDVRIIAATNRNLQEEVRERRFREDLFFRLNVFPLVLPPLRERRNAIPLLARWFLERFSRQLGKELNGFDPEALAALVRYRWPGNVRELENVIERASILSFDVVRAAALPAELVEIELPPGKGKEALKSAERDLIARTLRVHGGNRRLAAAELGISRRTLQYRLKEYGLLEE